MRGVVVYSLVSHVARDGPKVGGTEGLGPVPVLPSEGAREGLVEIQLVRGCALEALDERAESHARGEPYDDVHVIGCAPDGEHRAAELASLVAQDREEPFVDGRRQRRAPSRGGPHDVDENE
jgi:hypothetical protein